LICKLQNRTAKIAITSKISLFLFILKALFTMRLDGRRESSNVDDRRGRSTATTVGGIGLGGLIIIGVISLLLGKNPLQALQTVQEIQETMGGVTTSQDPNWQPSAQEQELAQFASRILAGTEDVWTEIFRQNGRTYEPPKLVLFSGAVQSGCGGATSSSGPFYCSADRTVYIDLSFFMDMRRQIGADGDFAYAYVIAHEVGHHVQNLLGTLSQAHNQMARSSEAQSNQISVRLELQADFYAGIWGYYDNKMFGSLEEGDIQEALNAASKIGDDYLQKKARGYTVPESFNHGTSAQREKWLKRGLTTGNLSLGDTFSPNYRDL
jgi:predicted metalloprotease